MGGSIGADALPPGWLEHKFTLSCIHRAACLAPPVPDCRFRVTEGGRAGADPRGRSTAVLETALRTESVCVFFLQAAHVDAPRAARSCQEMSSAGSGHHDLLIISSLRAPQSDPKRTTSVWFPSIPRCRPGSEGISNVLNPRWRSRHTHLSGEHPPSAGRSDSCRINSSSFAFLHRNVT